MPLHLANCFAELAYDECRRLVRPRIEYRDAVEFGELR